MSRFDRKRWPIIASGRSYDHMDEGEGLKYRSKHGDKNQRFNGKAKDKNGNPIFCRHLSDYVVSKCMKDYHDSLSSLESIAVQDRLANCKYDAQRKKNNSKFHKIFSLKAFGAQLKDIASFVQVGDQRDFLFASENHMMAITIRCKEKQDKYGCGKYYVVKFYDPNKTTVHIRTLCDNLDVISKLTLEDFLADDDIKNYFPKYESGVFVLSNPEDSEEKPDDFDVDMESGFYHALFFGVTAAVEKFGNIILASNELSSEQKTQLLAAENKDEISGLCRALTLRRTAVVEKFGNLISQSNLTLEQKNRLLFEKDNLRHVLGKSFKPYDKYDLWKLALADNEIINNVAKILLSCNADGVKVLDKVRDESPEQYAALQKLCETACEHPKLPLKRKLFFAIAMDDVKRAVDLIKNGYNCSCGSFDESGSTRGLGIGLRIFIATHPSTQEFFKKHYGYGSVASSEVSQSMLPSFKV